MAALSRPRRAGGYATFAAGLQASLYLDSGADSLQRLPETARDSLAVADSLTHSPGSPVVDLFLILAGALLLALLFHRRSS